MSTLDDARAGAGAGRSARASRARAATGGAVLGALLGVALAWAILPGATAPRADAAAAHRELASDEARAPADSAPLALVWEPADALALAAAQADAAAWWATWPELGAVETAGTAASPAAERARRAELRARLPQWPTAVVAEVVQRLAGRLAVQAGEELRRTFRVAFDGWVERDPAAAAQWAGALGPGAGFDDGARDELRRLAGHAWARRDLTGALAWAQTLPDAGDGWGLAARIVGRLADREPARARALLATLAPATARAAEARVFDGWAKHDPAAALQTLGAQRLAAGARLGDLGVALGGWINRDPAAAMRWLVALPEAHRTQVKDLVQQWSWGGREVERTQVAAALTHWPDRSQRGEWLGQLLFRWAGSESGAKTVQAAAWLRELDDPALRLDVLGQLRGWSYTHREDLSLAFAELLPRGQERDGRIAQVASQWAERDPEAALAWLAGRDEPAATRAVQARLLGVLARDDPAAALAQWGTLTDSAQRHEAADVIARQWQARDPVAAADWRLQAIGAGVPAGRDPGTTPWTEYAWADFMRGWVQRDAAAALAWAEAVPDEALRRGLIGGWARGMDYAAQGSRAPATLSWPQRAALLAQVRDGSQRTALLRDHVGNWLAADRATATAWLETSDALPAEEAAKLLPPPEPARGRR